MFSSHHFGKIVNYFLCIFVDNSKISEVLKPKKGDNKLGLSWAKLSQSWGLKLVFDVEV